MPLSIQQATSYYFKPSLSFLLSPQNVSDLELEVTHVPLSGRVKSSLLSESSVFSSHSFIIGPESWHFCPCNILASLECYFSLIILAFGKG